MPGKPVQIDNETWQALDLLGRDLMKDFQELADEAFADLLRKHQRPVTLKDALKQSARRAPANDPESPPTRKRAHHVETIVTTTRGAAQNPAPPSQSQDGQRCDDAGPLIANGAMSQLVRPVVARSTRMRPNNGVNLKPRPELPVKIATS